MGSFEDQFNKDLKDHGVGGGKNDWFKVEEGENKIRVCVTPMFNQSRYKYGTCYEGADFCKKENLGDKENLINKWLAWIIDRKDGKLKLYNMPFTVSKSIVSLKTNAEYAFEDFPMPFDITLNVKGAGTKEVEYTVLPGRKEFSLTDEEKAALEKESPVEDIIAAMKDKARKQFGTAEEKEAASAGLKYPDQESKDSEEIPF